MLSGALEPNLLTCFVALAPFVERGGVIVDAGANDGTGTLQLAQLFANRTVIGVEPTAVNVRAAEERLRAWPDATIVRGVLWDSKLTLGYDVGHEWKAGVLSQIAIGNLKPAAHTTQHNVSAWPLDRLLTMDLQLGLLHLDVEGCELRALRGAVRHVLRDRPVLSVESYPRSQPAKHAAVATLLNSWNFTLFEVDETCGTPKDCRNFIAIPSERKKEGFVARELCGKEASSF